MPATWAAIAAVTTPLAAITPPVRRSRIARVGLGAPRPGRADGDAARVRALMIATHGSAKSNAVRHAAAASP